MTTTGRRHRLTAHPAAGLVAALASAAAFGASGPFVKPLLEAGWSPAAAVAFRAAAGGLVLLPFGLASVGWQVGVVLAAWRRVIAFGLMGVAGTQLCYFAAVERLPVGVALLVEYLGPVLLVGFTWFTTRTRPPMVTLAGAFVATGGLFLVLDLTGATDLDPIGIVWALGAAVCLAGYFALSAVEDERLPPVTLAAAGLVAGAVGVAAFGATGAVPLEVFTGDVDLLDSSAPWFVPMAIIVLLSTSFSYATGVFAAARLGSRVASFIGLVEVLFAVLLSWLLLDEVPAAVQVVGGVLIIAGVVLVRAGGSTDGEALAVAEPVPVADQRPAGAGTPR
jgi:drug/metabolite transporter (DMT)-like permease